MSRRRRRQTHFQSINMYNRNTESKALWDAIGFYVMSVTSPLTLLSSYFPYSFAINKPNATRCTVLVFHFSMMGTALVLQVLLVLYNDGWSTKQNKNNANNQMEQLFQFQCSMHFLRHYNNYKYGTHVLIRANCQRRNRFLSHTLNLINKTRSKSSDYNFFLLLFFFFQFWMSDDNQNFWCDAHRSDDCM